MPIVSVTRLHLRSLRFWPMFALHTYRSARQLRRAPGFLGGVLASDPERGSWTMTAWEDEGAMRAYRNSGAHLRAMPRLLRWCDEASFVHWPQPGAALPSGEDALARMRASGRVSKVRHPSARHMAGETAGSRPPRPGLHLGPKGPSRG